MDQDRLDRVVELCQRFPEFSTGEPGPSGLGLRVRGKNFAMFWDNHHDDGRIALWCKEPNGAQAELVASDPELYFVPPYVGGKGWVGVRLDLPTDRWDEIDETLEEAYRATAPKKLVAQLDSDGS